MRIAHFKLLVWLVFASLTVARIPSADAQPVQAATPTATATVTPTKRKGETEVLVAPGGGAVELPIHAGAVCILSFPEKMASSALASSRDLEVKSWGGEGVAVRASEGAKPATLALATASGSIKVNVTLRIVAESEDAFTLVRFKAVSAEDAFESRVAAEVARRLSPIQAELATAKQGLDERVQALAEALLIDRLLKRTQTLALRAHERNDRDVVVHVERAALVGDDGYLFFRVENQSSAAFRLASVRVTARGNRAVAGQARLLSSAIDKDPKVIGVVPGGTSATGLVVVRGASGLLGAPLTLELAGPDGRDAIRLSQGIALR
jgi:Protein of unknown function (DUF2381)